ncbi:LytTR family DNA-binding domain-containing protein [Burkholderiaceae bacterium DAT-1]|nr:LytTR family DNA-binding domain-containing protein [Burkholderiaceae bacterium DAT-1]
MKILIAEDEPLMMERLQSLLALCWPEAEIVAACRDGILAWEAFVAHDPDVAFLDIRMPGMSGLDLARRMMPHAHIVFVTAYDQYAVAAFDTGAVDYLLKPIDEERLQRAVARLKDKLASAPSDLSVVLKELQAKIAPETERLKWIKATVGRQIRLLRVEEILFLQSDTKYTRVVTKDSEAFIRTPLKELLARLDPDEFWQVHRGTVVQVGFIKAIDRLDGERLEIVLDGCSERLPVSRAFAHLFRD